MLQIKKGSVFYRRLVIAFLFIVLIYTLGVIGVFFYKNHEITTLEQHSQQVKFVEQARDQIDTRLKVGINLLNQLKMNEYIVQHALAAKDDYYTITKVLFELRKYINGFTDFGYRIDIVNPDSELVITPFATLDPARYFAELGISQKRIEAIDSRFGGTEFLTTFSIKNNEFITMVRKVNYQNGKKLYFILSLVEENLFPAFSPDKEEGIVIIDDQGVITSRTSLPAEKLEQLFDPNAVRRFFDSNESYIQYTAQNQNRNLHVIASRQKADWKVVYIAPRSELPAQMRTMLLQTVPLYGLLMIAGLLLVIIMANRTYRPIHKVVAAFRGYNQDTDQMISDRDELTYIQETTVKIRTDNEKLARKLKDFEVPLKVKLLRELLSGLTLAKPLAEIPDYERANLPQLYCVVIMEYGNYTALEEALSQELLHELKRNVFVTVNDDSASQSSGRSARNVI
ncbi:hypothetical protein [Paenibacillus sp. GCM10027626]|uniref:hypothetical protein n=1 Tax=Paenibacillus sp. GCM10027626 TaxID=3273411 RepID=UPI0036440FCF